MFRSSVPAVQDLKTSDYAWRVCKTGIVLAIASGLVGSASGVSGFSVFAMLVGVIAAISLVIGVIASIWDQ